MDAPMLAGISAHEEVAPHIMSLVSIDVMNRLPRLGICHCTMEWRSFPIFLCADISTRDMCAHRTVRFAALLCPEWVSVQLEHLIVATAQFIGFNWPLTQSAGTPHHLSAPTIVGGPILPKSFVVQEAQSLCSVLALALRNLARWSHVSKYSTQWASARYRALGNAVTVQVAHWIGERILSCERQSR